MLLCQNKQHLNKILPWETTNHNSYGTHNTKQQSHIGSKAYCKYICTDPYALKEKQETRYGSFVFSSFSWLLNSSQSSSLPFLWWNLSARIHYSRRWKQKPRNTETNPGPSGLPVTEVKGKAKGKGAFFLYRCCQSLVQSPTNFLFKICK